MDLTIMHREEVEEFFNTMDRDFDGRLSFEVKKEAFNPFWNWKSVGWMVGRLVGLSVIIP